MHGGARGCAPGGAGEVPQLAQGSDRRQREDAVALLAPAVATVEGETRMIDFREQLVELLRPDDEGFDDPPREGLVKVFRPAGCWVYRVDLGQEDEFRRWVADRFRLDELGAMEVTGEFPMLRVVSPLD
jgi:hypothetical protein